MLTLSFKLRIYNKDPKLLKMYFQPLKEFIEVALNLKYKTFIIYIVAFNVDSSDEIYLSRRFQIAH